MTTNRRVTVFGAYGHTGRFVIAELLKRGLIPIVSGRDHARLRAVARGHSNLEVRVASVDDPASLEAAVSGSGAVVNCAGPFVDTALPMIEAAIGSGVHYLDVTAEQAVVLEVFERFRLPGRVTSVLIAPAMAFFGALGDLMATAAMRDWEDADEICIAVALDSWKPTRGTRLTGERNHGERFILSNGRLLPADSRQTRRWAFPEALGEQHVLPFPLAETIVISHHLRAPDIRAFISRVALAELRDPETPPPVAADTSGRSSQRFLMDVIARRGGKERRVVARGRDIYAVTAPIVVEATQRVLAGAVRRTGAVAAGEAFDAREFLNSLRSADLAVDFGHDLS